MATEIDLESKRVCCRTRRQGTQPLNTAHANRGLSGHKFLGMASDDPPPSSLPLYWHGLSRWPHRRHCGCHNPFYHVRMLPTAVISLDVWHPFFVSLSGIVSISGATPHYHNTPQFSSADCAGAIVFLAFSKRSSMAKVDCALYLVREDLQL